MSFARVLTRPFVQSPVMQQSVQAATKEVGKKYDWMNKTIDASRIPLGYVGSAFGRGVFAVHGPSLLAGRIAMWKGGGFIARWGAMAAVKPMVPFIHAAGAGVGGAAFGVALPFVLHSSYNLGKSYFHTEASVATPVKEESLEVQA